MDQDDLNKVTAIIQKLDSIKTPELPRLSAAIEQAISEINKYTGGGPLTKAWNKLKTMAGIDNPVVKVTVFANALERGFAQVPTILRNNGINLKNADLTKSLATMLADPKKTGEKSDKDIGMQPPEQPESFNVPEGVQNEARVDVAGKLKIVVDQLQKALAPGGIFGAFKKVPYINGQELAQELVQAPINVFAKIAKKIQTGAKAADVAPDLKSQITGQGGEQTKPTTDDDPTKKTQQTQPTSPSGPTNSPQPTVPTGEHPTNGAPGERGGGAPPAQDHEKVILGQLKDNGTLTRLGINIPNAKAFIKAINDLGVFKQK
jgi:hypothetical protein